MRGRTLIFVALGLGGLALAANFAFPARPRMSAFAPQKVQLSAEPRQHAEGSLPFVGAAAADLNGDGRPELVIGGGKGQADQILSLSAAGSFQPLAVTGLGQNKPAATLAVAAVDADLDGDVDLFISREDGVTLYSAEPAAAPGGLSFQAQPLALPLPEGSAAISIAVSDLNRNERPDLLIATWPLAAGQLEDARFGMAARTPPLLLIDDRDGYINATKAARIFEGESAIASSIADLDADGAPDLVLAYQGGRIDILRNRGNLLFEPVTVSSGLAAISALGIADVSLDGRLDLIATGPGDAALAEGVSTAGGTGTGWATLIATGPGLSFTDDAESRNLSAQPQSFGLAVGDFDADGRPDFAAGRPEGWTYRVWYPAPKLDGVDNPAATAYFPTDEEGFILPTDVVGDRYEEDAAVARLPTDVTGAQTLAADLTGDGIHELVLIPLQGEIFIGTLSAKGIPQLIRLLLPPAAATAGTSVRVTADRPGIGAIIPTQGNGAGMPYAINVPVRGKVQEMILRFTDGSQRREVSPAVNQILSVNR